MTPRCVAVRPSKRSRQCSTKRCKVGFHPVWLLTRWIWTQRLDPKGVSGTILIRRPELLIRLRGPIANPRPCSTRPRSASIDPASIVRGTRKLWLVKYDRNRSEYEHAWRWTINGKSEFVRQRLGSSLSSSFLGPNKASSSLNVSSVRRGSAEAG